jgi:hypothetical protein
MERKSSCSPAATRRASRSSVVGLWSRAGEGEDFEERLTKAFDVQVVTSLTEALQKLTGDVERETEAALSGSGLV